MLVLATSRTVTSAPNSQRTCEQLTAHISQPAAHRSQLRTHNPQLTAHNPVTLAPDSQLLLIVARPYQRHVVALDGTSIKSKEYKDYVLLMLVTYIAGSVIPLAAAISPSESTASYKLLLRTAANAGLDINNNVEKTVIFADRAKGLAAAAWKLVGPFIFSSSSSTLSRLKHRVSLTSHRPKPCRKNAPR